MADLVLSRRRLIGGLFTAAVAPAIVRASSLMPVRPWPWPVWQHIVDPQPRPLHYNAAGRARIDDAIDKFLYDLSCETQIPVRMLRGTYAGPVA